MVLLRAHAAAFADFDGHGPADHVARRQVLHGRRIALHEALAFRVGQIAAFAAHAFGDQYAGAEDAGGMELHELHVLQRQAGAQHHAAAVARAGVGRGAGEIGPAVAACGQDHQLGLEPVQGAVVQLPGGDAPADAVVHDQVEGEVLDEELGLLRQCLAIHGVQHGVAGAIRGRAGALDRRLAEVAGHAAEGALIDLAFGRAAERHAPVLQLVDRRRRVPDQVFNGVLVAQPVRPLDGVVHVPAPVILAHVAEAGGDAALGGHGVRPGRKDLGDAGGLQARRSTAQGCAQAGAAGAHHDDVIAVIGEVVGSHGDQETPPPAKATLRIEKIASAAQSPQTNRLRISSADLVSVLWM